VALQDYCEAIKQDITKIMREVYGPDDWRRADELLWYAVNRVPPPLPSQVQVHREFVEALRLGQDVPPPIVPKLTYGGRPNGEAG
jgi:hypothetical protein